MTSDVLIVGGGLGGAALGWRLSREGIPVTVFERETEFRDRVRGEGLLPWGVNEARDLGIEPLLLQGCALPIAYWTSHAQSQRSSRNLIESTPRGAPCLDFLHAEMQEVLLRAAAAAGADVRRGVRVVRVDAGAPPRVITVQNGREEAHVARLVVGADGRTSKVRDWVGFEPWRAQQRLRVAGVLLEGCHVPHESVHVFRNSSEGIGALFFPQRGGAIRGYAIRRRREQHRPLSGSERIGEFIDVCCKTGVPADWINGASPAGPLAEFDGPDTWVERPYRNGVALVGDAASTNDPAWGNGLSLTIRDVRVLAECLLEDDDWDRAGTRYARLHDEHFGAVHRITTWLTELLYEIGDEAGKPRRERAFAAMSDGRSRNPDFIALGPAAPSDEEARCRMFGESYPSDDSRHVSEAVSPYLRR